MKRKIFSLAVLGLTLIGFNLNAQSNLDLSVKIQGLDSNYCFHADSNFSVNFQMISDGADTIPAGAKFTSYNSLDTKVDSLIGLTFGVYDYDFDTTLTFNFGGADNEKGSTVETLLNIDSFLVYGLDETNILKVVTSKADFVDGQSYLFFANFTTDSNVVDTVVGNNFHLLPVVWECAIDSTGGNDTNNSTIRGLAAATAISVYPNPAASNINVQYDFGQATPAAISIFDINGRVVYQENHNTINGVQKMNINVSDLSNGNYFIRIQTNANTSVSKFAITR